MDDTLISALIDGGEGDWKLHKSMEKFGRSKTVWQNSYENNPEKKKELLSQFYKGRPLKASKITSTNISGEKLSLDPKLTKGGRKKGQQVIVIVYNLS